jgi:hypothetical protein
VKKFEVTHVVSCPESEANFINATFTGNQIHTNDSTVRAELKKIDNQRTRFSGIFQRKGKKKNYLGYSEETILLNEIKDEKGNVVTDHIWFNLTKAFDSLGQLQQGDVIEFEARVSGYTKGYMYKGIHLGRKEKDFKLSRPTQIKIVSKKM